MWSKPARRFCLANRVTGVIHQGTKAGFCLSDFQQLTPGRCFSPYLQIPALRRRPEVEFPVAGTDGRSHREHSSVHLDGNETAKHPTRGQTTFGVSPLDELEFHKRLFMRIKFALRMIRIAHRIPIGHREPDHCVVASFHFQGFCWIGQLSSQFNNVGETEDFRESGCAIEAETKQATETAEGRNKLKMIATGGMFSG